MSTKVAKASDELGMPAASPQGWGFRILPEIPAASLMMQTVIQAPDSSASFCVRRGRIGKLSSKPVEVQRPHAFSGRISKSMVLR